MRPGWYNFFILVGTGAVWSAWGMVVTQVDPGTGGTSAFVYFFTSFFFALLGTIYLLGYVLQTRIIGRQTVLQSVRSSTRQALLFATLLTTSLALQGWRLLTWYNALILVALLTFIELLFITRERTSLARRSSSDAV